MNVLIEVLRNSRAPSSHISWCWIQCVRHASRNSRHMRGREAIEIPNRIHRGPTDILKALDRTVRMDYTGPTYRFHDDPMLTAFSNSQQRAFFMSYQSGRNAARWIRDEHSLFFQQVIAEPRIECYLPKKPITDETPVGEALLLDKIKSALVSDAKKVYELMVAKGMDISHQSRQAFLEMLCYFNSEDPVPEDSYAERFHMAVMRSRRQNSWKYDDPLVQTVFDSIEPKDSAAYSALICGLYHHGASQDADDRFEEASRQNITLDIKVYNYRISRILSLYERYDKKRDMCLDVLKDMNSKGIKPDAETLHCATEILLRGKTHDKYEIFKKLLREFRELGVEPSLGTYACLSYQSVLDLPHDQCKRIIQAILNDLKGKELKMRHPFDNEFLVRMMDSCSQIKYAEGALDLVNLAHDGNNKISLGSFIPKMRFYNIFLCTLIQNGLVEVAVEWYKKLVPHHTVPTADTFVALFDAFETMGMLEHVVPFWADFMNCSVFNQTTLMKIMGVAVSLSSFPIPLAQEVKPQLAKNAAKVWEHIEAYEYLPTMNMFSFTDEMADHLLVLFAQAHEWALVQAVMERMNVEGLRPTDQILENVITWCIEDQNGGMAAWVTKFALQKFQMGAPLAERLCTSSLFSEESKEEVRQILIAQGVHISDSDTSSSSSSSGESDGDSSDSDDDLSIPKKEKQYSALPQPQQKV